jgi:hypothetical protein
LAHSPRVPAAAQHNNTALQQMNTMVGLGLWLSVAPRRAATENQEDGDMTKKIFNAKALRPQFIRLYGGNGTYGVYIVFADQSEVPLYEGPSAAKAIHFAATATANFEINIQTDFQADSLLPGELELSYY